MKPLAVLFLMVSITLLSAGIADSALTGNGLLSNGLSGNGLSGNHLSVNGLSNGTLKGPSNGISTGISKNIIANIQPTRQSAVTNISKPVESTSPGYRTYTPSVNLSSIAKAKALSEFFNDYIEWCMDNSDVSSVHDIEIYAATNQQDNTVSYINGILKYSDETGVFEGAGKQYFNNRMWNLDTLTNPYQKAPPIILYPFDPTKTDAVDLALDTASGILTINHVSGGGVETVDLQIASGILSGFSSSGLSSMYTISLSKHKSPA